MSELQPNQTPNFRRFADWCLHKDSLSTEARHTVEVLLEKAGTCDCYEAEQVLANCTELSLRAFIRQRIPDLSPLSGLIKLTKLDLGLNRISDLSPLSALTKLKKLLLDYNRISDLSPLLELTNLTELYLDGNGILDLSPLSGLRKLKILKLKGNAIDDLSWLPSLQSKWCSLLTLPINEQKSIETVKYAYTIIGIEKPDILVFSSPQAGITYLSEQQNLGDSLVCEICYSIGKRNRGLWFLMSSQLQNKFSQEQPLRSILNELWGENNDIDDEYEEDDIEEDIDNSEFILEGSYITSDDLVNAIAATELLIQELHYQLEQEEQEALQCLNQLFENCGWIFPFEKVCIVCDRPRKISLDTENRLHAEGEPAIVFSDGWHTGYYYHGVKLPEKYGKLHPHEWQAEWLLEEDNAELRRILIQGIGYDRICEQLKAQVIDSWQEYTLLRIDADIDVEPIHLLKMTCPSTAKIHTLRVPPEINSARVAIRWVNWDIEPENFSVQT